jgi:hypothetical protein
LGRAGEGYNPLETGHSQYAAEIVQTQEQSEVRLRIRANVAENFILATPDGGMIASSDHLQGISLAQFKQCEPWAQ